MDGRIEDIARAGGEFAAEYVGDVLAAAGTFLDRLIQNVATLTRGVIQDGSKVVSAACDLFLPDDADE